MSDKIDIQTRQQVAVFLPLAITKTLKSYDDFMAVKITEKAKDFLTHHNACKAAISHLELLLKLAEWAHIPDIENQENQYLSDLMAVAKQRIKIHSGECQ